MKQLVGLLLVAAAIGLCGCGSAKEAPVKQYQLRGRVLSVSIPDHTAKIKGDKIEGWMEAMTMDYPVEDDAQLRALRPDESITATVYVQDLKYWIGGIHELPPEGK